MSVEEIKSDDEMPELEAGAAAGTEAEAVDGEVSNRSEKKARKAMMKLGMKAVPDVTRVTIKKAKNIMFVIAKPEVFKSPQADTYVIFGEAKIEDMSQQVRCRSMRLQPFLVHSSLRTPPTHILSPFFSLSLSPPTTPQAAQQEAAMGGQQFGNVDDDDMPALQDDESMPALAGDDDDADATGLDDDELQTIVAQANCTKGAAIKALRKHGNIVDAILELTP
jgi:nascent polypeptide-associated complex subunit alpha